MSDVKLCVNCKWAYVNKCSRSKQLTCLKTLDTPYLVTGEKVHLDNSLPGYEPLCHNMRYDERYCGLAGVYYEPK